PHSQRRDREGPCSMRSRGKPDAPRPDLTSHTPRMSPDEHPIRVVPLESRRWRNKVALVVTLCVLLGVLMWVGGGGLDIQPSSSSDEAQHGTTPNVSGREGGLKPKSADRPGDAFDCELDVILKKSAAARGLNDAEIEEARVAARDAVREALRKPGDLPPRSIDGILSASCDLQVEGLPLYHDKGQTCCKAAQKPSAQQQAHSKGDGPQGRRGLEAAEGEGGEPLPGVLRTTQRAEAAGGNEVACLPSFIIAGTQKSGTTALTGILEKHPQVMMAERKELHFFDHKTPNQINAASYAFNFPSFNASQAVEHRAPFVVGEATPFYLASRKACMNMRKLVPDVRLLVLVRDPVKRAYSEHQMKVRRVEEQGEMLELLPLHANKIYDCAVKLFPSLDGDDISESERSLLSQPQDLSPAMGECAGEIGQHGKWIDAMIPFIRKVRGKLPKRPKSSDKPVDTKYALEVFREDMSRCFPLKTVVDKLQTLHPGGAWRQGWARTPAMDLSDKRDAATRFTKPLPPKFGGVGGARGKPRRVPGKLGLQHRGLQQYYEERGWTADDLFAQDHDGVMEYYWNSTSGPAAAAAADGEYFGLYGPADFGWGGEGWAAAEDGLVGDHAEERRRAGDYVYGADALTEEGGEVGAYFEERGGWDSDAAAVEHWGRRLSPKQGVLPDVPWPEVWGSWGEAGERTFDETCYQRMERVVAVENVMKAEIRKLKHCFNNALGDLGGLSGLDEADPAAAAEALDSELSKCFNVTPGISDQYIYRSLYGIQAYHCLKYIPRNQVMFIESDDLRDKPEEVLPRVHEHIGEG
ncbi:unnamed protein product, partial [Ectocarpus sp. 12 AP-2014]